MNKYNPEGYPDPTAYEALTAVTKEDAYKPLVFICSPFAGDVDRNTRKAQAYCRLAYLQNRIPFAPHLLFPQFMDDLNPKERKDALFMGSVLLGKCKEVWVFGDAFSSGMNTEIEKARQKGVPIRYFTEDGQEVTPA